MKHHHHMLRHERIITSLKKMYLPRTVKDRSGRKILIKIYQPEDCANLLLMYHVFEPKGIAMGVPPLDEEVRIKWIDSILESFFNILAIHEERVIGHASFSLQPPSASPEYSIFLHQDYRRQGIGTHLTRTIRRICREMGCDRLWVAVPCHNVQAINFFKKLGFKFTGPIDSERQMVYLF